MHYHDPVPHVPLQAMGYVHVAREIFYTDQNSSTYKVCDKSGEDPTCSDSVPYTEWNPDDHMYYMGIYCGC